MIYPKKSLGQNFLNDQNIIKKIINLKNIKGQNIVEIGPGKGAITDKIINEKPNSLILIEKDFNLLNELKEKYKKFKFINFYNEDILKLNLEKIIKKKSIIFGNLPYNISSQILIKLIRFNSWPPKFTDLIFMFQKEVAEKILGHSYGRLSVISNYRLKILKTFNISANCFFPKPKVISSIVHFIPVNKVNYKIKDIKNLELITNIFFSNRRKMINKSIKKIFNSKQLSSFKNLNLKLRPSDLKYEFYYQAAEIYEKK